MVSDTDSNYSDNSDFLLSDLSEESELLEPDSINAKHLWNNEIPKGFIEKYMDKEIFILDYDDTIKLHCLSWEKQQRYEEKLYKVLYKLKTEYNKKIYLVSYNLKPFFAKKYKQIFEEIYIPVCTDHSEFSALQKELFCGYTLWFGGFYRYIPKHIHIKEIADKNNVDISKVVFFDDNLQQVNQARQRGIHSVLIDKYIGIEL